MWWREPVLRGYVPLLPAKVCELTIFAWVMAAAGGLARGGPAYGRQFEEVFCRLCDAQGVPLCEHPGAKTLVGATTSSGYMHEIDACSVGDANCAWELKHLKGEVPKNELLIFNSKTIDYAQGFDTFQAAAPLYRFLLTSSVVDDACRQYGAANGIMVISPGLLPIPLMHEALIRGLSPLDREHAVEAAHLLRWACRPLQMVMREMAQDVSANVPISTRQHAQAALTLQRNLHERLVNRLQEHSPDWESDALASAWHCCGGWI